MFQAGVVVFGLHQGDADADTFPRASCRGQCYRTDSTSEKSEQKFTSGFSRIADREEEAVADILVQVFVIYQMESVFDEHGP